MGEERGGGEGEHRLIMNTNHQQQKIYMYVIKLFKQLRSFLYRRLKKIGLKWLFDRIFLFCLSLL